MGRRNINLKTILKLTAITTLLIHIYNQIIIYQSSVKDLLSRVTNKKYFQSKNGTLFYTRHGEGSPILLIHDLTAGGSGYEWKRVQNEIAKNHTVYTVDLLGCGKSQKERQRYTTYFYVEALNEFIQKVIRQRTDIIASGYSGSIAILLKQNNEDLIHRIMLVNPCSIKKYNRVSTKEEKILYKILFIPVFGTLIYHMLVSRENIDNLFIENYYYDPFHLDNDMEDAYYEAAHKNHSLSKYLYASLINNFTACNIEHAIKNTNMELFIVFGEAEPNAKEIINQYQSFIPELETSIIDHTKHFPHVEQTEAFLKQVDQYFI